MEAEQNEMAQDMWETEQSAWLSPMNSCFHAPAPIKGTACDVGELDVMRDKYASEGQWIMGCAFALAQLRIAEMRLDFT